MRYVFFKLEFGKICDTLFYLHEYSGRFAVILPHCYTRIDSGGAHTHTHSPVDLELIMEQYLLSVWLIIIDQVNRVKHI